MTESKNISTANPLNSALKSNDPINAPKAAEPILDRNVKLEIKSMNVESNPAIDGDGEDMMTAEIVQMSLEVAKPKADVAIKLGSTLQSENGQLILAEDTQSQQGTISFGRGKLEGSINILS